MHDTISQELREVEREIDNFYKTNHLVEIPFGEAAWYLLAFYENIFLSQLTHKNQTTHNFAALTDNVIVEMQHPLLWLWKSCPRAGIPPQISDENLSRQASSLSELAQNYDPFYLAFTYASHGWSELRLHGEIIESNNPFLDDLRYEAYGRLIQEQQNDSPIPSTDLADRVNRSISILGGRFVFRWGRRLIENATSILESSFNTIFELPAHWSFENYSLLEFRRMAKFLIARSFLHKLARYIAASRGIPGAGYTDSLIIETEDRLAWNIIRYAEVTSDIANHFIYDLTYGSHNMRHPDPALQPLIKANEEDYILMPSLLTSSSMERNFIVLLNRIPETRSVYLQLVQDKEAAMRQNIIDGIGRTDLTYWYGNISIDAGRTDIDLAIISEEENAVLVAELKWFIFPAEPREIIEKSEEIRRGIKQLLNLEEVLKQVPQRIYDALGVDDTFRVFFVVISENYIGTCIDQHLDIPVIQRKHLVEQINSRGRLVDVVQWLMNREYLPVEGAHFTRQEMTWEIGPWKLSWYGVEPLVTDGRF